jgi:NADH-quinone oxidoreductase subunit E
VSVDSHAAATADGTPHEPPSGRRTLLTETTRSEMGQIIARYPQSRSALLPMLHLVQSVEGYVTQTGIEMCAEELDLTTAEVSAVATFYTMYKRRPVGEYHVGVCTNTLCAVLGGDAILHELEHHLGIGHDETTPDGKVSLEHIECNAACDYAPMLTVNWEFLDAQTPASAVAAVDTLREGGTVRSTRGPAICTWRQASRVLAGFPDGAAGYGPAAGPATLAGLKLAREHDWRAPGFDRYDDADDTGGDSRIGAAMRRADAAAAGEFRAGATASGDRPGVIEGAVQAVEAVGHWIGEHLPGRRDGDTEGPAATGAPVATGAPAHPDDASDGTSR